MPEVLVQDRPDPAVAAPAVSASQGTVAGEDLQDLPILRRGELLESVPGMVVTQHSGDGKANQYFLRGFNLDHGTDFAFSVDGVPGQPADTRARTGLRRPQFPDPRAGRGHRLQEGPILPGGGRFSGRGRARTFAGRSAARGDRHAAGGAVRLRAGAAGRPGRPGRLIYAFEYDHTNGPWHSGEHANQYDGVLRYRWEQRGGPFAARRQAYASPTGSRPIRSPSARLTPACRAVRRDRPHATAGGPRAPGSSAGWTRRRDNGHHRVTAYGFFYRLNLFSDFTYFLDDPVNGDQFQQIDRRFVAGVSASRRGRPWWGRRVENTVGVQLRNDDIPDVGSGPHGAQARLAVRIDDDVEEAAGGAYLANQVAVDALVAQPRRAARRRLLPSTSPATRRPTRGAPAPGS